MTQSQLYILGRVAKLMGDSDVNKYVYSYLKSTKDDFFNYLKDLLRSSEKGISDLPEFPKNDYTEKGIDLDFRFNSLLVKSLRKYSSEYYWGLNMMKNENYSSLILLGGNGVGKSSLYNAMEYQLTNDIYERKFRNCDLKEYLHHDNEDNTPLNKSEILLFAGGQMIGSKGLGDIGMEPSICFCSDGDVVDYGKSLVHSGDTNWFEFFARSLGYGIFIDLINQITEEEKKEEEENQKSRPDSSHEDPLEIKENIKKYLMNIRLNVLSSSTTQGKLKSETLNKIQKNISYEFSEVERWTSQYHNYGVMTPESQYQIRQTLEKLILKANTTIKKTKDIINAPKFRPVFWDSIRNLNAWEDALKQISDKSRILYEDKTNENKSVSIHDRILDKELPALDISSIYTSLYREVQYLLSVFVDYEAFTNTNASIVSTENIISKLSGDFELYKKRLDHKENLPFKYSSFEEKYRIRDGISKYKKYLIEVLNEEVSKYFDKKYLELLKRIMAPFMSKNEEILISNKRISNVDFVEFNLYLSLGQNSRPIAIKNYFNTFRYRLFCIVLRVSIALMLMEKSKCNIPLVFDDVFYASDYNNRAQIACFIKHLFVVAKNLTGNDLQLIFFTHDELILEAFYHAVNEDSSSCDLMKEEYEYLNSCNFIFGKLYDYRKMKDAYYTNYYNVADKSYEYQNLYIELFKDYC